MAQVIVSRRLAPVPADVARVRAALDANAPDRVAAVVGIEADVITRLAREFAASRGGLAVAGGIAAQYPNGAEIVAAVNILNCVAGQVGKTGKFGPNHALAAGGSFQDLTALAADASAGKVALLLVHGANPAHSLPAAFSRALAKAGYKVSFSSYLDETAAASDLVLPDLHPLEQWNDSEPRSGVYALQQPVMQPVFPNTRHAGDVLLGLAGKPGTFKEYLQGRWQELHRRYARGRGFDEFWDDALQHGGMYGDVPGQTVRRACLRRERRRDEDRRPPPPGDARRGCARAGKRSDRGSAAHPGAAAQAWRASVPGASDAALCRSGTRGVGGRPA